MQWACAGPGSWFRFLPLSEACVGPGSALFYCLAWVITCHAVRASLLRATLLLSSWEIAIQEPIELLARTARPVTGGLLSPCFCGNCGHREKRTAKWGERTGSRSHWEWDKAFQVETELEAQSGRSCHEQLSRSSIGSQIVFCWFPGR